MKNRLLVACFCLGLAAIPAQAQTSPRRELWDVLQHNLEPAQFNRVKGMVNSQFDPQHSLGLTPQEEADLRALFGDVQGDFRKHYPNGLQDWVRGQVPIPAPAPTPAPVPAVPRVPQP